MRKLRFFRVFKILFLVVVAVTVFSFVVMMLWNWLMPSLFGLHAVGFWQALGLLALSKILFGGFRGRTGFGPPWRQRMFERWEQMTPEERERFRAGLRGGCGPIGTSPAEPKA